MLDILLPDTNNPQTNKLMAELTDLPIILCTSSRDAESDNLAQRIGAQIVRRDQPVEVLKAGVRKISGMRSGVTE